jgi:hypothetical protein
MKAAVEASLDSLIAAEVKKAAEATANDIKRHVDNIKRQQAKKASAAAQPPRPPPTTAGASAGPTPTAAAAPPLVTVTEGEGNKLTIAMTITLQ